jgi:hypothetical protein
MRLLHNYLLLTFLKIGDSLLHSSITILSPLVLFSEKGRAVCLLDEDSFIEQMEDATLTRLGQRAATIRRYWKNEDK